MSNIKKLHSLLELAHKINEKSQHLIPYSSNKGIESDNKFLAISVARSRKNKIRNAIFDWDLQLDIPLSFKKKYVKFSFFKKKTSMSQLIKYFENLPEAIHKELHKDGSKVTTQECIEHIVKRSFEVKTGNCQELSACSFVLLQEQLNHKYRGTRIEFMSLSGDGADHAFLVINRKKNSDLNDTSTWGDEAIILDSWWGKAGTVFHLGKKDLTNDQRSCLEYINSYENLLIRDYVSFIGADHSLRWLSHRELKGDYPSDVGDWVQNEKDKKPIPFVM